MRAPFADVQKLVKLYNFPMITLMRYSAAVLSVIFTLLGRTTHTLHVRNDCQTNSYRRECELLGDEMGNEKAGCVRGRVSGARKLSPLCNLCIFY